MKKAKKSLFQKKTPGLFQDFCLISQFSRNKTNSVQDSQGLSRTSGHPDKIQKCYFYKIKISLEAIRSKKLTT